MLNDRIYTKNENGGSCINNFLVRNIDYHKIYIKNTTNQYFNRIKLSILLFLK